MERGTVMDRFSLKGKTAVVLGGSGVLGAALCRGLAEAGADIAVVGSRHEKAEAVAVACRPYGSTCRAYGVDAASKEALGTLSRHILSDFGRIDILVNGVGGNRKEATTNPTLTPPVTFFELSQVAMEEVFELNVLAGAVLPSQVFGKILAGNADGGVIINITSMNAFRPLTRIPAYSAAKAAVSNFTQWLAVDLAKTVGAGLRVNAIAPGFFFTEQNRFLLTDEATGALTPRGQTIMDHTPMGRFGDPDDLIGALVWLASDASRFVTGIVVPVDGGFSAFSGV